MSHGKPLHYLIRQEVARKAQLEKDAAGKRALSRQHLETFKAELQAEARALGALGAGFEIDDDEISFIKGSLRAVVAIDDDARFVVTTGDASTTHKSIASVNTKLAQLLAS